ncbi:MAG: hypothetical protein JXQ71_09110 [Verrucomicrobia bacterium]|nr:hypothetical protein [Verrucomicrobiota bacterium]
MAEHPTKTPRDLLLSRHQHVVPRLDALRRRVVAEHVGGPALVPAQVAATTGGGFLTQLWTELFWSCRRAWIGLAVVWGVLLGMHLAGPDTPRRSEAKPPPLSPATLRLTLAEQHRLRAELPGLNVSQALEPHAPTVPGPRSETRGGVAWV